jgi:hypothetical protein
VSNDLARWIELERLWRPGAQGATVGALGVRVVPIANVDAFDGLVRQFDADVAAWKGRTSATATAATTDFWIRWDTFRGAWAADRATIGGGNAPPLSPSGLYGDENVDRYEARQREFNALVAQGKAAGVVSAVTTADNLSPLDKVAAELGQKATTAASWAPWIFGAALVLAVGYVAGPIVAALVARRAAGLP